MTEAMKKAPCWMKIVASIFALIFLFNWPSTSGEWAAWVQAIGVIAAIAGSYHLGERQYIRDQKEQQQRDWSRQTEALNRAMAALDLARNRVGYLDFQMRAEQPEIRSSYLSDVNDCVGVLRESLRDIKYLPGSWVRGTQINQSLRKVFELSCEADAASTEDSKQKIERALQQSGQFLAASIEYDQILRAEINGVSQQSAR